LPEDVGAVAHAEYMPNGKSGARPKVPSPEVARLMGEFESDNSYVRCNAARALGELGDAAAPAVHLLVEAALHDIETGVGKVASESIGQLGEAAEEALPSLRQALQRGDPSQREAAARTLRHMGKVAASAISELLQALDDEVKAVRIAAAGALAELGKAAAAAVPALAAALTTTVEDDTPYAIGEVAAAAALQAIGAASSSAVPELQAALSSDSAKIRAAAADVLGVCGESARPTVRQLAQMALHDKGNVSPAMGGSGICCAASATSALRELRETSASGVVLIAEALRDTRDQEVVDAALAAFTELGKVGAPGLPILLQMQQDTRRPEQRARALDAMGHLGKAASEHIPRIAAALQDHKQRGGDARVSVAAAGALFNIAESKPELVLPLTKQLEVAAQDANEEVASAVQDVLRALEDEVEPEGPQ